MGESVIFIAGIYGVGKSTLIENLSVLTNIPAYSVGDLISEKNGENYTINKAVKDSANNQNVLLKVVKNQLKKQPTLILAGHFCIFNSHTDVENLPEFVYKSLPITKIILLEADIEIILRNLYLRDGKNYTHGSIELLMNAERSQAIKISSENNIPVEFYKMKFNEEDVIEVANLLRSENNK